MSTTIKQAIDGFLLSCKVEGKSYGTIECYSDKLKSFLWYATNYHWPDDMMVEQTRRYIIKLQKEIAELEAAKERLPERVAKLETEVQRLIQQLPDLLANCVAGLYVVILIKHGWNPDEATEEAKIVGKDFIEHLWPQH